MMERCGIVIKSLKCVNEDDVLSTPIFVVFFSKPDYQSLLMRNARSYRHPKREDKGRIVVTSTQGARLYGLRVKAQGSLVGSSCR